MSGAGKISVHCPQYPFCSLKNCLSADMNLCFCRAFSPAPTQCTRMEDAPISVSCGGMSLTLRCCIACTLTVCSLLGIMFVSLEHVCPSGIRAAVISTYQVCQDTMFGGGGYCSIYIAPISCTRRVQNVKSARR
jgi:hypothetical protein